jgi:hypothetical protein
MVEALVLIKSILLVKCLFKDKDRLLLHTNVAEVNIVLLIVMFF